MQSGTLILFSALVGAITGLLAAAFVFCLNFLQGYFMGQILGYAPPGLPGERGVSQIFSGPQFLWIVLLVPIVFGLASYFGAGRDISWLLTGYRRGEKLSSKESIRGILGSLIQLATASPMGREGPIAAMGLWLGSFVGRTFHIKVDGRFLPFAGLAGGFAAAFHAPMAGALLASEIVYKGLALEVGALAPAMIGALAGFSVFGSFFGYGPLLDLKISDLNWTHLVSGLLIGISCALVGNLWQWSVRVLRKPLARIPYWGRHSLFGLLIAILLVKFPESTSNSLPWVQLATSQVLGTWFIVGIFLIQLLLVILAGSGRVYGGHLTPALAIGGMIGIIVGKLLSQTFFDVPLEAAALAGISGMLAGISRAPFAAVVLGGEIAGYNILPIVLTSAFVSYGLSNARGVFEIGASAIRLAPEKKISSDVRPDSESRPSEVGPTAGEGAV